MKRTIAAAASDAGCGIAGTVTMSMGLLIARKAGLLGRYPPEQITVTALDAGGAGGMDSRAQQALAGALHLGFGGSLGIGFGLLRRRLRLPSPPAPGMAFGALVWLISYKGWLPALGLMPPPERDKPTRPPMMVLAHLVYGATLDLVMSRGDAGRTRAAPSVPGAAPSSG